MNDQDIDSLVNSFEDLSFKEYLKYKGKLIKTKEDYYQMVREEMRDPYAHLRNYSTSDKC